MDSFGWLFEWMTIFGTSAPRWLWLLLASALLVLLALLAVLVSFTGESVTGPAPEPVTDPVVSPITYPWTKRIGGGGLGDVYLSEYNGGPAAVKVMKHAEDEEQEEKRTKLFASEAALLEEMDGRGSLPRILAKRLGEKDPYFVMEYVEGPTLKARVKAGGPMDNPADIGRVLLDLSSALSELHQHAVIHRDLNPSNVILSPKGPRLVDLGIGKQLSSDVTETYIATGTLPYMAPEIANGYRGTCETDVYGWGLTAAYVLTGRNIRPGGTNQELILSVAHGEVDPAFVTALETVAAKGPWHSCLVAIVRNCLAAEQSARPRDGADLWKASNALCHLLPDEKTGYTTHEAFDRAVVRQMLKSMDESISGWDDNTLPGHLAEAISRLLRIHPTATALRRGISAAVLYGVFMGPKSHLGRAIDEPSRNRYMSPSMWEDLLQSAGIDVMRNRDGLLVFP